MQGPSRLAPGTRFAGEYTILRPLAEGGMGGVYVARQESTGRERALKVMHPWLIEDPTSRMRFEREARVGAVIESDHVVDVVAAGVDERTGLPFIAMELLSGKTLREHVAAHGLLPLGEVRDILAQIAHALGAAHRKGLVHRDLKPENVMIADAHREGQRYTVKLLDFGIAKLVQERRTNQAATGAIGSPLWMAPEQTEESTDIGPRTDVFAFGLLAFWLLTGKVYWTQLDGGVHVLLRQLHVDELEPASARALRLGVVGRIPTGFDAWLARAMARPIAERFADATAAMAALSEVFERRDALGVAGTVAAGSRATPIGFAPPTERGVVAPQVPVLVPPTYLPPPEIAPRPAPPRPTPAARAPHRPPPPQTPIVVSPAPVYAPPPHAPPPEEPASGSPLLWTLLFVGLLALGGALGVLTWMLVHDDGPSRRRAAHDAGARVPTVAVPDAGPPLAPPLTPLPPTPPFRAGQAWRGTYTCTQTATLTLDVRAVFGLRVEAIFRFENAPASGSYHLHGDYDRVTGHLLLTPDAWIQQPPGYVAVGMDGALDATQRVYSGRMLHPECGEFSVRL